MQLLFAALAFLTILPWPGGEISPQRLPTIGVFFPLVGWGLGLCLATAGWLLLMLGLSPLPTAALLVALSAWLTRGLHLDGVADLCDGLGGACDPAKRLAIMKDSATGAFGVIGLVLVLLLKTTALSDLLAGINQGNDSPVFFVLFCLSSVPALGRFAILLLSWKSRYPRQQGTGHAFVGKIRGRHLLLGGISLAPLMAAVGMETEILVPVISCCVAAFVPVLVLRRQCRKLLGGITGDVLGAGCEFSEMLGWLVLAFFF
ncbi:MAG: adenosylcobinamide-GDP ribazoletransferase [Thermodesulfobacteriota bacterium]